MYEGVPERDQRCESKMAGETLDIRLILSDGDGRDRENNHLPPLRPNAEKATVDTVEGYRRDASEELMRNVLFLG